MPTPPPPNNEDCGLRQWRHEFDHQEDDKDQAVPELIETTYGGSSIVPTDILHEQWLRMISMWWLGLRFPPEKLPPRPWRKNSAPWQQSQVEGRAKSVLAAQNKDIEMNEASGRINNN
jgi:hypothetical protein